MEKWIRFNGSKEKTISDKTWNSILLDDVKKFIRYTNDWPINKPLAARSVYSENLLGLAMQNDAIKIVRYLFSENNLEETLALCNTPMEYPVIHELSRTSKRIRDFILSFKEIDINVRNNDGYTLLHYLVLNFEESRDIKRIRYFLNYGADVNIPNNNCDTPMHIALKNNLLDVFRTMIDYNPEVDIDRYKNKECQTVRELISTICNIDDFYKNELIERYEKKSSLCERLKINLNDRAFYTDKDNICDLEYIYYVKNIKINIYDLEYLILVKNENMFFDMIKYVPLTIQDINNLFDYSIRNISQFENCKIANKLLENYASVIYSPNAVAMCISKHDYKMAKEILNRTNYKPEEEEFENMFFSVAKKIHLINSVKSAVALWDNTSAVDFLKYIFTFVDKNVKDSRGNILHYISSSPFGEELLLYFLDHDVSLAEKNANNKYAFEEIPANLLLLAMDRKINIAFEKSKMFIDCKFEFLENCDYSKDDDFLRKISFKVGSHPLLEAFKSIKINKFDIRKNECLMESDLSRKYFEHIIGNETAEKLKDIACGNIENIVLRNIIGLELAKGNLTYNENMKLFNKEINKGKKIMKILEKKTDDSCSDSDSSISVTTTAFAVLKMAKDILNKEKTSDEKKMEEKKLLSSSSSSSWSTENDGSNNSWSTLPNLTD